MNLDAKKRTEYQVMRMFVKLEWQMDNAIREGRMEEAFGLARIIGRLQYQHYSDGCWDFEEAKS